MEFRVGQKVEVIGSEDGLEGSYYAAEVIAKEDTDKYKVKYKTFLRDDSSGPLVEVVNSNQLRPEPPEVPNDGFSLEELVDAYVKDGWWVGAIEGKFQSEYFVLFPPRVDGEKEELPFTLDKLRVHLDWKKGKWKPCSVYKTRIKNSS